MSNEADLLIGQLIDAIKRSQEYNQYQNLLESVKNQPELFQRIGEFRRRSLSLQLSDSTNLIEENNALQQEFADLQSNGIAGEFLAAEHQYCKLIRHLQDQFLEQVDVDIDFLEK